MASKTPPAPPKTDGDPFELVERFAEQLMDVCAEERRLVDTLARTRAAKALLVSTIATHATAATQGDLERRLRRQAGR